MYRLILPCLKDNHMRLEGGKTKKGRKELTGKISQVGPQIKTTPVQSLRNFGNKLGPLFGRRENICWPNTRSKSFGLEIWENGKKDGDHRAVGLQSPDSPWDRICMQMNE